MRTSTGTRPSEFSAASAKKLNRDRFDSQAAEIVIEVVEAGRQDERLDPFPGDHHVAGHAEADTVPEKMAHGPSR